MPDELPSLQPGTARTAGDLRRPAAHRLPGLPGRAVPATRRASSPTGPRLGAWGSWVNAFARKAVRPPAVHRLLGRPGRVDEHRRLRQGLRRPPRLRLVRARRRTRGASLLPQEITEFTNAGIMAGLASVNLADDPFGDFDGFWGACSTYGSFSLPEVRPDAPVQPAGPGLRAQGRQGAVGRRATPGPRRPRTRRTHFGIFETGGHPALPGGPRHRPPPLGVQRGARSCWAPRSPRGVPIVALHLTRPGDRDPRPGRRSASRRTSRRPAAPTSCATSGPG